MKTIKFNVPIFDIDVILIQVENGIDKDDVLDLMYKHEASHDIIVEVGDCIDTDSYNGSSTFWNKNLHRTIIVFYPMNSYERKLECYAHEKRHLEDRILSFCNINDRETAAYLSGWLSIKFKELFDEYNPCESEEDSEYLAEKNI